MATTSILGSDFDLKLNRFKQVMLGEWANRASFCDESVHNSAVAFTEEEVELHYLPSHTVQELVLVTEGNFVRGWLHVFIRTPAENADDLVVIVGIKMDYIGGGYVVWDMYYIPPGTVQEVVLSGINLPDAGEHTYYLLAHKADMFTEDIGYAYNRRLGVVEHVGK